MTLLKRESPTIPAKETPAYNFVNQLYVYLAIYGNTSITHRYVEYLIGGGSLNWENIGTLY